MGITWEAAVDVYNDLRLRGKEAARMVHHQGKIAVEK